jgi:hypothetical protein
MADIALRQGVRRNPPAAQAAGGGAGQPAVKQTAIPARDHRASEPGAATPATTAVTPLQGAGTPPPAGTSEEAVNLLALQARQHLSWPARSLCAHTGRGVLRLFV